MALDPSLNITQTLPTGAKQNCMIDVCRNGAIVTVSIYYDDLCILLGGWTHGRHFSSVWCIMYLIYTGHKLFLLASENMI